MNWEICGAVLIGASLMYPFAYWSGYRRCIKIERELWFTEGALAESKKYTEELRARLNIA